MPSTEPRHFTRDKSLVAEVADQFGGGTGGNAEALVEANQMRYSEELTAAQLLQSDPEASAEYTKADVAKAAELPEDTIVSFSRHGDYVVYSFETPDERVHKDALLVADDGLESPYDGESPQRAAIRAQIEAIGAVSEARSEADDILAKAREEADRIIGEAAQEAEQKRAERVQGAQKAAADRDAPEDGEDAPKHPRQPANPRSTKDGERKSGGGARQAAKD